MFKFKSSFHQAGDLLKRLENIEANTASNCKAIIINKAINLCVKNYVTHCFLEALFF